MSVNKVWNFKPLISAILGFAAILLVNKQIPDMSRNIGLAAVFIGILLSQVLFEITSKYEGKTCEFIDGVVASLFAVLAYFLGITIGGSLSSIIPDGVSQTLNSTPGIITGGIFAAFTLWVWKQWLRNKILPSECAPCNTK